MDNQPPGINPIHQIDNTIDWDDLQPLDNSPSRSRNPSFRSLSWKEVLHDQVQSPHPLVHQTVDPSATLSREAVSTEPNIHDPSSTSKTRTYKKSEAHRLSKKGKKRYNEIRSDPKKWEEYKAKERKWAKDNFESLPTGQQEEKREKKRLYAAEYRVKNANKPNKKISPNSRMIVRAKIDKGIATEADIKRYHALLERDKKYHSEARSRRAHSGHISKKMKKG